ncbi:class I SAM-dependent methyltransferase [Polymorphobacter sp.]|uniref:class I SAM-dependent methyltransferase n=1 Tax=Polymorphobacter sp. TaxID=1909290 RepID=UPI003F700560
MADGSPVGWDPALYAANAAFVPALGHVVLDWLAPKAGERILDLGCGDGALTARIVASGAEVDALDADAAMIGAARARGLSARVCDARDLSEVGVYDAVFSNATLHWIRPPETVIANVARALKPGGRFVGEFGGHGNIAAIRAALSATLVARGLAAIGTPEWQFYPAADEYEALLEAGGFRVSACEIVARPTPLPGSVADWLRTFRGGFLDAAGVPEAVQAAVIDETEARLAPMLRDGRGRWTADYVRLRFSAFLPE